MPQLFVPYALTGVSGKRAVIRVVPGGSAYEVGLGDMGDLGSKRREGWEMRLLQQVEKPTLKTPCQASCGQVLCF